MPIWSWNIRISALWASGSTSAICVNGNSPGRRTFGVISNGTCRSANTPVRNAPPHLSPSLHYRCTFDDTMVRSRTNAISATQILLTTTDSNDILNLSMKPNGERIFLEKLFGICAQISLEMCCKNFRNFVEFFHWNRVIKNFKG